MTGSGPAVAQQFKQLFPRNEASMGAEFRGNNCLNCCATAGPEPSSSMCVKYFYAGKLALGIAARKRGVSGNFWRL